MNYWIALYSENCVRAGKVAGDSMGDGCPEDFAGDDYDVYTGSRSALEAEAHRLEELSGKACAGRDLYLARCARSILEFVDSL